ncbi:hypothetical protein C1645_827281 [Glomus cerebriforme]|uniref:Uncharacterized protein n=1 Tax=Glomus cerebriforme TaxID=658196 RepID=A0A397SQ19_9GLOM|nr:hypothetical protein C1645_827281 [Glomus cerebriforme]
MSSQASSPTSPASMIEEIFTRTISDIIKELIEYLKRKDLKLDENNIKILCKEKIAGSRSYKTIPYLKLLIT